MKQDEPINADELMKNAYKESYENPIQLDAEGGVHSDSMPRVRAFAGNKDSGFGTYQQSQKIKIEVTADGRDEWTEVEETESKLLVDDVAHAMIMGTKDRIEGDDKDPERAL
jgi:hypothetical protein